MTMWSLKIQLQIPLPDCIRGVEWLDPFHLIPSDIRRHRPPPPPPFVIFWQLSHWKHPNSTGCCLYYSAACKNTAVITVSLHCRGYFSVERITIASNSDGRRSVEQRPACCVVEWRARRASSVSVGLCRSVKRLRQHARADHLTVATGGTLQHGYTRRRWDSRFDFYHNSSFTRCIPVWIVYTCSAMNHSAVDK